MPEETNPGIRIIVVLGMHRSGTSAITRGLIALGAETGEQLMPAAIGVNDKGFWEDQEFNTINIAVLHALGHDWHTLTPIKKEELATAELAQLRLRALDFLRERTEQHPIFVIKDPRTARLLPFWQDLFARVNADVSYVIAVRHPISVARSLAARNGVPTEKSHYLWLEHLVAALTYTANKDRVVIDYDRLMDDPRSEMVRLSIRANLAVHPGGNADLDKFIGEFLEEQLRHSRFDQNDLELDPTANNLLLDLYDCLQEIAADKRSVNDPAVNGLLDRGRTALAETYSLLKYSNGLETQLDAVRNAEQRLSGTAAEQQAACQLLESELEQSAASREQSAHRINELVGLREAEKENSSLLSALIQDQRRELEAANQALIERSAFVEELQQRMLDELCEFRRISNDDTLAKASFEQIIHQQRQELETRSALIDTLNNVIEAQKTNIAEVEKISADRANHIDMMNCEQDRFVSEKVASRESLRQMESKLAEIDAQRKWLATALTETRASHSWRLAAPARAAANIVRAAGRRMHCRTSSTVRRLYRALPLSLDSKLQLKTTLFSSCGFLLANSLTYKQWKANQDNQAFVTTKSASTPLQTLPAGTTTSTAASMPLQDADGTSEWTDYAATRDRIRAAESAQRSAWKFTPFKLIDVNEADLAGAASNIRLQATPSPMVSIIVPVYNQIKCTLECLTSIIRHTGDNTSYEIIVADDASTDETSALLGRIEHLRISRNRKNLGFLRNCNEAAKLARGRYILLLNNDVQVTKGWLDALIEVFQSSIGVGAVGPKIVYPSGHLQEAGVALRRDGTAQMIGVAELPEMPQYNYQRDVDYCSGACLLLEAQLFRELGGLDDTFAPAYCEDADLCMQIHARGLRVVYSPRSVVIHHLSKTSDALGRDFKLQSISNNVAKLTDKWQTELDRRDEVRVLAFYLPQFHPIPENDSWWGKGFTEWVNVSNAKANFVGHYQPRQPADLGYYDLRISEVMQQQATLAQRYGIDGFCFYYYWFNGKRLLEQPLEHLLGDNAIEMPFCLCWANENWTRRWDGRDNDILIEQNHSDADDLNVIEDLMRYFHSPNYVRVNGKPLVVVYRVTLFPDFQRTAVLWRTACREAGIGEIHLAMVESFELVHKGTPPSTYGCDASIEFPPQELAEAKLPSGEITNPEFDGRVADYRDLAVRCATRPNPGYCRFRGVTPGWDNTARRQHNSFCFEHATPGVFQAWLETAVEKTKSELSGDERIIFINAWNEWAEGAYLEPDRRFGHTFLEAVKNARESAHLQRMDNYMLGN